MNGSNRRIYLDHAASTPVRPEVREAMEPYWSEEFGNPSGAHRAARAARRAVDEAREALAAVLGCEPADVVFTSGGTESDNLAVTGSALHALGRGAATAVVCCSAIEHPAVLEPVRFLGGAELPVHPDGLVDLEALEAVLANEGDGVALVSVMLANNEIGVVEPVAAIAALVRERAPQALVHTDAVQALRWIDLAAAAAAADLVSVTAHKIGGPKGIGALVARPRAREGLTPILRGGPQERELRAGTLNVAGIVGFARAAELAAAERSAACAVAAARAAQLRAGLQAVEPKVTFAAEGAPRLDAIVNAGFPGISSEELLFVLDELGVAASAGSACASGALEPSPVLSALGLTAAEARSHVRFSLGPETTEDEVAAAVDALGEALGRLRA